MGDPIKLNSDSWTGRDPARAASNEVSPEFHSRMQKFAIGMGAFALVHFGYALAIFDSWDDLISPLITILAAFYCYNLRRWTKAK